MRPKRGNFQCFISIPTTKRIKNEANFFIRKQVWTSAISIVRSTEHTVDLDETRAMGETKSDAKLENLFYCTLCVYVQNKVDVISEHLGRMCE